MAINAERIPQRRLHPLHGILLGSTVPLFLGAVLGDLAYASSFQIQWSNFASWFIAGGLIFNGLALLWAVINIIFGEDRDKHAGLYAILLAATWILGFFNALVHARDAWAMMPTGLILSVIVLILAGAATWIGFAKFGVGGGR